MLFLTTLHVSFISPTFVLATTFYPLIQSQQIFLSERGDVGKPIHTKILLKQCGLDTKIEFLKKQWKNTVFWVNFIICYLKMSYAPQEKVQFVLWFTKSNRNYASFAIRM